MCKLNNKIIQGVYDINPYKYGRYTPGSKIPIIREKEIFKDKPDYLLLLIWHFKNTLKIKLKNSKKQNQNLFGRSQN